MLPLVAAWVRPPRALNWPPPFCAPRGLITMFCLTCACGGRLSAARSEFAAGHYAAAKQDLVAAEGARHSWPICDRAVYALYRGLTHGALGDAAGATLWLREAYDLEARHPGCLGHDGDARLQVVLRTYGLSP